MSPFLPGVLAPAVLGVLLALWARRGVRGRLRAAWLLLAVALVVYAGDFARLVVRPTPAGQRAAIRERYDALWSELEAAAERAAARIELSEEGEQFPLTAFQVLRDLAAETAGSTTYLLLDPDGETVAWAGEGLVHEISGAEAVVAGRQYRPGFSSVTLIAVQPLEEGPRPWRAVAGRSYSAEWLPFYVRGLGPIRWTVVGDQEIVAGFETFGSVSPRLAVRAGSLDRARRAVPETMRLRRWAGGILALGLTVAGLASLGRRGRRRSLAPAGVLLATALVVVTTALGVGARQILPALLAVLFAALVWGSRRSHRWLPWPLAGLAAAAAGLASSLGLQGTAGPIDLAGVILPGAGATVLRLTIFCFVIGVLGLTAAAGRRRGDLAAWSALGAILAAGALVDRPFACVPLLVAAAVLLARWVGGSGRERRASAVGLLLLATALLSAASWEVVHRHRLRAHLERDLLPQTAPPSIEERQEIARRTWRFFRQFDLGRIALKDPARLDLQDLGLAVWKESGLPTRGSLSAVVIESWDGRRSSFSFGLPLDDEGDLDRSPLRGQRLPPPELLRESLIEGAEAVELDGLPWGFVRYWILLRPGFRLARDAPGDLAGDLLRGGPDAVQPPVGLFEPAKLAIWPAGESVPLAPWSEGPVRQELVRGGVSRVEVSDGPALAFATGEAEELRALILPLLAPVAAIERVSTHALGLLLLGVALGGLALLLNLSAAVGALRRASRSYSRRLLLVTGGFVLAPILALNLFLVRIVGERLEREQLAAGRQALESAERILGEYVLTLDPGFVIETALDDELLVWLSRVARHEVNLYWGSRVYASSRRELFTAGLLPERIPGEVYSRLALRGARFASRTNRTGAADYLELYQPVRVPGILLERLQLVASMPLLAQQEELAGEIARLHRRAFLATAALVLLLAAVGSRLARGFTKPLMELVEGTQRIAAGARSMNLQPSEQELATLAEAIDRMAERIARGRQELVREKNLVERMIDNINSGVVSVDQQSRALMANRVAQRLLEVRVGESLLEVVAAVERLEPVADFLRDPNGGARQRTVRLSEAGGEEREWTLVWVPLPGEGEPSALLVVEDVTEVLRGQRLQAWAEMARIIAHEIKNPLTPIRLSAEHMQAVHASAPEEFDDVFERCTKNILAQVGELQEISTEFMAYSRIPRCEPAPGDLAALVREIGDAYRWAPPAGTGIELSGADTELPASFDSKLLGRALRNLIENAVRATTGGGRVAVSLIREAGRARIEVSDSGPGVPEEDLARIFDPYFSTHDAGTGLGLPIARRIAEEHGGTVRAENLVEGGLRVAIVLPVRDLR